MNKYEYILQYRSILEDIQERHITISDTKYIPMYQEYETMRKQGEKYAYVLCVLSRKYNLTERAIQKIVQRLTVKV